MPVQQPFIFIHSLPICVIIQTKYKMVIKLSSIKRNSIQTKIIILFMSLAVLLFITVGILFFKSTEGAINSSKRNELITLSYETSNKIERFMFERYGDIQVMADSPLLKNKDIDRKLVYDYLESVRTAYKTYDYIFVTDYAGNINNISGDRKNDNEYKRWIKGVLKGKTLVSDFTYINSEKAYSVYFASPIINNSGKVSGAVVERMNFNSIADIVKKVRIGKSGYAYLYNNNGAAIFVPDDSLQKSNITARRDTSIFTTTHNGVKFISAYYPIKKYETQKNRWYLVVQEPYKEAFMVAANLRNYTILLIFISVIALFVLALIMSEIITKPIRKLVAETQNIVEGNITHNIKVESKDEIGSLANSFNALLNSINSMMQQILDISVEAASLEDVRQYADRFFENIPSAIITVDGAGNITTFNSIAYDITGIKKEDILGKNIQDIKNSCINSIFELMLHGIEGQIIYKKHIIKIKNIRGEDILVMVNTTIQKGANNNLIGVIAAFKLTEEIKQFEASVLRAKNLASLGALSAGMAHEIRNPLTSIKGYAQYLKSELKDNEELTSDISIIINEVDRLNGIIDRFLTFARPQQLKLSSASINKVCMDVIKLIDKEIKDNNIKVIESYEEIPLLNIDADQMEQVLLNIVINSIQAMSEDGEIRIKTNYNKKSNFAEIAIKDNGVGIAPEDFDNIFEPFFTTKEKGTGLGLAICSRIIEEHKGFLEVSSKPGLGTEFTIKLPINHI